MKIHQLSIFLQNEPGQVIKVCRTLRQEGIDIRTLMLADSAQYGILRLIVSDWEAGARALGDAGFVVNDTEVIAAEVPDEPGGLAALLELIDGTDTNIEYMYTCTLGRGDRAVLLFRFDDPDRAIERLRVSAVTVLNAAEVYLCPS